MALWLMVGEISRYAQTPSMSGIRFSPIQEIDGYARPRAETTSLTVSSPVRPNPQAEPVAHVP